MSKFLIPLLFLCISLTICKSGFGFCPKVSLQENFDFSRYTGNWYEIIKSKNIELLEHGSCGIERYTKIADNTAHVQWTELVNGKVREMNQTLTCDPNSPQCHAKLFPVLPAGDYKVFSTDYEDHAIVYSCIGLGVYHVDLLWIMGREKTIGTEKLTNLLKQVEEKLGFTADDLVYEDLSTCDLYPK